MIDLQALTGIKEYTTPLAGTVVLIGVMGLLCMRDSVGCALSLS
jgi:hypothetical protein